MKSKNLKFKIKNYRTGFTLAEMIIAMAIFSIFTLLIVNVTISVVAGQRKVLAIQDIQEAGRFMLETVGKEIKTASVNSVSGDGLILDITNDEGNNVVYSFDEVGGRLLRNGFSLSPDNVSLSGFFDAAELLSNPRVTVVLKIKTLGVRPEAQSEIYLQTTISPR